jgi:ribosomal protein S18 acetylase RimI-like enzyme
MEVLDLRHFAARQMRPLLEQEARVWERRLRWDYRASIELLLEYLDGRVLPGFVALAEERVCGYTFCVYEGPKAVVGDAFSSGHNGAAMETTHVLLRHLLELLVHSPQVDRVESQLLLYDRGEASLPFLEHGFRIYPRLFMEGELTAAGLAGAVSSRGVARPLPSLPTDLTLAAWSPEFYQSAGELVHAAYRGHLDGEINDQYRSLHGSLRFLHNIVRFPGCGIFDSDASCVLRDSAGALQGMLLCSRVRGDMGHITQLCIAPERRGQGLGRLLMQRCAAGLASRGFKGISLTVTQDNTHAVRLYEDLGLKTHHSFDAMVWNRSL